MRLTLTPSTLLFGATALLALACSGARAQQPAPAGCATVEIRNLVPGQGQLKLNAFSTQEDFNLKPVSSLQVQVGGGSEPLRLQVCGLGGTAVALSAFQDLNANGKLDRNPMGVPTEPWGASGKPVSFSAPTWATSQVPLDGQPIVITLAR